MPKFFRNPAAFDAAIPNAIWVWALSRCSNFEAAAAALVSGLGANAALVKGGHRDGPPHDLLALRQGGSASFEWLRGERIDVGPVRGTGCALSAAIAAHLARGESLPEAVAAGRRFVAEALRKASGQGQRARLLAYGLGQ